LLGEVKREAKDVHKKTKSFICFEMLEGG
jgi:hypothetical protein